MLASWLDWPSCQMVAWLVGAALGWLGGCAGLAGGRRLVGVGVGWVASSWVSLLGWLSWVWAGLAACLDWLSWGGGG